MDKNSSEDKSSNHSNQVPYTCKMQLLADQDAVLFHLTILQHNAVEQARRLVVFQSTKHFVQSSSIVHFGIFQGWYQHCPEYNQGNIQVLGCFHKSDMHISMYRNITSTEFCTVVFWKCKYNITNIHCGIKCVAIHTTYLKAFVHPYQLVLVWIRLDVKEILHALNHVHNSCSSSAIQIHQNQFRQWHLRGWFTCLTKRSFPHCGGA